MTIKINIFGEQQWRWSGRGCCRVLGRVSFVLEFSFFSTNVLTGILVPESDVWLLSKYNITS